MKKLEADLISIAHRILQLKNKSDINQLYQKRKSCMKTSCFKICGRTIRRDKTNHFSG
jgi:hypothetical protein